ncbi:MAG TPA: hypothetical protein VM052_09570 [Candidatus Limnocylindrales bacterium]|nr:hypothetical protein [Candidatus Limnocylindrales bacterium]
MPPALVPLALIAIGVPAALRAALGRPRALGRAWLLALTAVAIAQAAGEITGSRVGLLGDAQVLFAAIAAVAAAAFVSMAERGRKR